MKKFGKIAISLASLIAASACFSACGTPDGDGKDEIPENLGSYTGINNKIADFTKGLPHDVFYVPNGYSNGGMFDCDWSRDNAVYDADSQSLRLKLTSGDNKIYGAECQTHESYGYGYYSVRMKAIKREGVVSSFFTYTNRPQWDEIDIEFLGKDTTKVQFNYFTNGVGKHEKVVDLGFDASKGFHEYGFKWEEDQITWYVDGKGVYRATANIPSHDSKIMMNVWNGKSEGEGNVKNWLGVFDKSDFPVPDAEYKWVSYKPLEAQGGEDPDPNPTPDPKPDPTPDPDPNPDPTPDPDPDPEPEPDPDPEPEPKPDYGNYTGVNDKLADFTYGKRDDLFEYAHDWTNGGMFDCVWSRDNVVYDSGSQSLRLKITDDNGVNRAGEYRTQQKYGYGYFSVNMKAIKRDGVITSLFTYTGPSDGTEWHEIDIEILGNDTTKVQFNYFTNGVGGHEHLYDLGFDASEGFHEYGFKWEQDKITWYVDGVGVYSATTDIPSVPGKIMINAWPGKSEGDDNVVDWSGRFDRVFPVPDAEYKWIGYKAI